MLRLIEGGAKTGKSTRVREELLALARQEDAAPGGLVLLVPEQFSYETEREYFTALGIRRADRVRVLSFQRLAQEIFREYGGLAGETADDSARLLAMKLALQDCKGELALYGPLVRRPDFPGQMVRAMAELKHAAVSPDALEEAAGKAQGFLRDKLADLSLIRNTYETLLGARFRDDEDDLDRAAQLIRENRWFAGKAVWLDGFKSFTAAQEQIIGLMLEQNAQVTAVLSLTSGDSRFSTTEETARRLRTLARKAGARTASPERLTEPRGFADDSLRWFADQALKNSPKPYPGENTGVRCCGLLNEFDEAAFAAAELLRLAKEEGYAYEEMAVLVRDMDRYAPLLEAALDRYGVPYYMDRVESIAVMPLTRFLLHAAGALATGFDRTEVLSFLKCGMTGLSLEELDAFEGYSYVWNISGDGFFTPFRQNPAGYAPREMSAREQEELARAEKVRELCCGLLSGFRRDGEETSWPQAAYRLLLGLELPERMSGWIQERRRQGRQKDADDLERTWLAVMELLNTMETMLTGQKLTPREFRDLFAVCAEGCSLGRIPQTLDSVQVGGADRVRVAGKKAVLLLGANEGEFPLLPSSEGVFTDKEREELAALGLELTGNQEERILEERFVAWQALSCPSERLTVVYSLGDIAGKPRYPSALVSSFREIFPDTPVKGPGSFPPEFFCRTPRTAFLQYVRSCTDRTVFTASARAFLEETGWQDRLSRLDETLERDRFRLKDPALARELFGGALRISSYPDRKVLRLPVPVLLPVRPPPQGPDPGGAEPPFPGQRPPFPSGTGPLRGLRRLPGLFRSGAEGPAGPAPSGISGAGHGRRPGEKPPVPLLLPPDEHGGPGRFQGAPGGVRPDPVRGGRPGGAGGRRREDSPSHRPGGRPDHRDRGGQDRPGGPFPGRKGKLRPDRGLQIRRQGVPAGRHGPGPEPPDAPLPLCPVEKRPGRVRKRHPGGHPLHACRSGEARPPPKRRGAGAAAGLGGKLRHERPAFRRPDGALRHGAGPFRPVPAGIPGEKRDEGQVPGLPAGLREPGNVHRRADPLHGGPAPPGGDRPGPLRRRQCLPL